MRRRVFIASLMATALLCSAVSVRGGMRASRSSAQEKPAATAEVKIDNFSFRSGGHHGCRWEQPSPG